MNWSTLKSFQLRTHLLSSLFFVILVFVCGSEVKASSANCYLTVQITEYPPLAMQDDDGQWHGINLSYIDALLSRADCKYRLIPTPFGRGTKLLEAGRLDMTLNFSRTAEREPFLHFIGPQRHEVIRLISPKGRIPLISEWQDFNKLDARLVWQTGAFYGKNMDQAIGDNNTLKDKVIYLADNEIAIGLLNSNQADGFFVEASYLAYQQQHNPAYQNIDVHPLVINNEEVFYAFSKQSVSPEQIVKLTAAFNELVSSGELAQLNEKNF